MVKLHKVFFYIIFSLAFFFFFNRNLAWNKIAIIHPNAFSTLPSLRKLWVFHDLFMACLLIIGHYLINQKWMLVLLEKPGHRMLSPQCPAHESGIKPERSTPGPCPPPKALWILIIENQGDSWFWLLRGDFSFLQAIRWNGVRHQFLSKGLSFHSLPYRSTENLPVHFYPPFPPLASSSSPLPCLREKEGNGSDRS